VEEPDLEPSLKVLSKKGPKKAKAQRVFECFPKTFDDGNGAGLANGTETLLDSKAAKKPPKSGLGKLWALVGYEMLWGSEPSNCLAKKGTDVLGGGLFGKDSESEGHSREDVESEHDPESKKAE
jgi:hypothetical protein